jgi:hypothetical protein
MDFDLSDSSSVSSDDSDAKVIKRPVVQRRKRPQSPKPAASKAAEPDAEPVADVNVQDEELKQLLQQSNRLLNKQREAKVEPDKASDEKHTEASDERHTEASDERHTEASDEKHTEASDERHTEASDEKHTEASDGKLSEASEGKHTQASKSASPKEEIGTEDSSEVYDDSDFDSTLQSDAEDKAPKPSKQTKEEKAPKPSKQTKSEPPSEKKLEETSAAAPAVVVIKPWKSASSGVVDLRSTHGRRPDAFVALWDTSQAFNGGALAKLKREEPCETVDDPVVVPAGARRRRGWVSAVGASTATKSRAKTKKMTVEDKLRWLDRLAAPAGGGAEERAARAATSAGLDLSRDSFKPRFSKSSRAMMDRVAGTSGGADVVARNEAWLDQRRANAESAALEEERRARILAKRRGDKVPPKWNAVAKDFFERQRACLRDKAEHRKKAAEEYERRVKRDTRLEWDSEQGKIVEVDAPKAVWTEDVREAFFQRQEEASQRIQSARATE